MAFLITVFNSMYTARDERAQLNVSVISVVYLLCLAPLLYTHTATIGNSAVLLLALFSFGLLGKMLLWPLRAYTFLIPATDTALSILAGGLVYSFALFINPAGMFLTGALAAMALLAAVLMRKRLHVSFRLGRTDVGAIAFALAAMLLISSYDIFEQFTESISGRHLPTIDTYYFTSLVTTLRKGSFDNAAYEVGSSAHYQFLGFFTPAALANMLQISSHQALWGIVQPFYKLLAFLMCYEVCYFFMRGRVTRANLLFVFLAMFLPILLAPLHPASVLKGKVATFMLMCYGYMLPNGKINWEGTVTIPLSVIFLLLGMILFFKANWNEKKVTADKVIFVLCLGLTMNAKTAMFVPYLGFIAAIMLKRIMFDKGSIIQFGICLVAVLVVSKYANQFFHGLNNLEASFIKTYIEYGYLAEHIAHGYKRSTVGLTNQVIAFALIPVSYLLWTSIRLLGLWMLARMKVREQHDLLIGALASLAGTTAMALLIHRVAMDEHGKVIRDVTFDSVQLVTCSFYILTIVAVIGILYYFFSSKKTKLLQTMYVVTGLWCVVSFIAIIAVWKKNTDNKECLECDWYFDNLAHLRQGKLNYGLVAVNPFVGYYGIMLASSDYGTYWSAMNAAPGQYNTTRKNKYRWDLYDNLMEGPAEAHLARMKQDGVKYIVAIPLDSARFGELSRIHPDKLRKMDGSEWVYHLN
jgi:hypothetical protein